MPRSAKGTPIERAVHWTLLVGVAVSALFLASGLWLYVAADKPQLERNRPDTRQLVAGAVHGDSVDLIDVGLLVLMTTPVARVLVLGVGWFVGGDRRFAAVAAVVFALLCTSVWLGAG